MNMPPPEAWLREYSQRLFGCATTNRPAPRHPARLATESTAGLLARGSPPVTAFPGFLPVALWHGLAAYSCGGSRGIGAFAPHRIPCSLSRERPSTAGVNGDAAPVVNVHAVQFSSLRLGVVPPSSRPDLVRGADEIRDRTALHWKPRLFSHSEILGAALHGFVP
jgi:hypothetical protein